MKNIYRIPPSGSYLAALEQEKALMEAGIVREDKLARLLGEEKSKPRSEEDLPSELFERRFYDDIRTKAPALWRACYPRIYDVPRCGIYHSPQSVAKQMALIAIKMANGIVGESEIYEFSLASHLAKYNVPMYWLSQNVTEALMHTTPPGTIEWYEMPLPFQAAAFHLPKGSLVHETDGDVLFFCYARLKAGEQHLAQLIPGKPYGSVNGSLLIGAQVEKGYFLHWNIPLTAYGPKTTMKEFHQFMTQFSMNEHGTATPVGGMKQPDHDVGAKVAHLMFSTLMFMMARPQHVTEGRLIKHLPPKRGNEAKTFWSPHVIGEHYKIRREPAPYQGGTHASPRGHWVPGHWTSQAYGPKFSLRKPLLIDPYWRGGDSE